MPKKKNMTDEEIKNGNKLIAEFLDYEIGGTAGDTDEVLTYHLPDNHPTHTGMIDANDLLFHTSWDWLMPVVEKIERDHVIQFEVIMYSSSIAINKWNPTNRTYDTFIYEVGNKIQATYKSVIEFIKFYNENQK